MAENLGDAILELKTDSRNFESGINKAGVQARTLGGRLRDAGDQAVMLKSKLLAIGAAVAAGAGITKAIFRVVDLGDSLSKMAQKTGIGIETLSELRLVADLGNTSIDELARGIKALSKNMFDVAAGAGEEAKRAFEALNLAVINTDGTLRKNIDVFFDISDAFKGMEDGAEKSAIASALLGRAGTELIPTLNDGTEAMKKQMQAARDMGLVFTQETGQQMEEFNDSVTVLKASFEGLWQSLVVGITPALTVFTNSLTMALAATKGYNTVLVGIVPLLENLGFLFPTLSGSVKKVGEETDKAAESARKINIEYEKMEVRLKAIGKASEGVAQKQGDDAFKRLAKDMEEGRELTKSARTDQEKLNDQLTRFQELRSLGVISQETFGRLSTKAVKEFEDDLVELDKEIQHKGIDLDEMADRGQGAFSRMQVAVTGWASGFAAQLTDAVTGADASFKSILSSFLDMIIQMTIQTQIIEPLLKRVFAPSNAPLPGMTGPPAPGQKRGLLGLGFLGLAEGGIVTRPTLAVVGEGTEPEVVAPLSKVPALVKDKEGAGGVVQNINISPGLPETVRAEIMRYMPVIKQAAVDAVLAQRRRGGTMAAAMGSRA